MANCLTLKKSNCKSCFRCVRKCPIKAIRFSGNQAHIIGNECILCGNCVVQCPQNAKEIADGIEKVRVLMQSGDPVVVSLAPSFVANYGGIGIESMRRVLKKLGFYDVEETAIGATIVKNEYERMLEEEERDIIITSCCHSINLLIQKRFPECLEYLADVMSPMQAHCSDMKKRIPNAFCGLLYTNVCRDKKKRSALNLALTAMALNVLAKPDFIAYNKEDRCALPVRITTGLYKAPRFVWTLRSKEERQKASELGECAIFEQ